MPHYLLAAHSTPDRPREPMSEDEIREATGRVMALEAQMRSASALVFGGRLDPPGAASVVNAGSGETVVTDGPFAETKEHLGGLYIIEAVDLDGAREWAAKTSACVNTPIEVRPFHEHG
jgi:hypothetical protein